MTQGSQVSVSVCEMAEPMARASPVATRPNAFIEIWVAKERLHSMNPGVQVKLISTENMCHT